jgi:hypothetical protein
MTRLQSKTDGYVNMKASLNLNNTELVALAWIDTVSQMQTNNGSKVVINFDQPNAMVRV